MIQNIFNEYLNGTIREQELLSKFNKLKKRGDYDLEELDKIINAIIYILQGNLDSYTKYLNIIDKITHSELYRLELTKNELGNDSFILTKRELENALSKLLFYTVATIHDRNSQVCSDELKNMLVIINKWIKYFMQDGNLLSMKDEEVNDFRKGLYSVLKNKTISYGEEIDIWTDVVVLYGSIPLNVKVNRRDVILKGRDV